MLTKDLVRFRRAKGKVHPRFIDPQKKENIALAETMLSVFEKAPGQTKGEILQTVGTLSAGTKVPEIVRRGLEKLLLDRTNFDEPSDDEMFGFRHQLFISVNEWMIQAEGKDQSDFERELALSRDTTIEKLRAQLYSDLPDFLPATRFRSIAPKALLYRYNAALVQWLLLQTASLQIFLAHKEPSHLRQLCKYLRFHQLLAKVTQPENGVYQIHIDGPMNLFHQTQKYGMSLARFFPALLHQPVWRLQAKIKLGKRQQYELELDHQSKLKPYYHHFHAYIPKEIQRFEASFKEKANNWHLEEGSQFIPLPGEQLCFPDFRLSHPSGLQMDMEFFHSWHATPLLARLQQLKDADKPLLLLGVSRKLHKDPKIAKKLEKSAYFQSYGFLFSEIPSVRSVQKILKNIPIPSPLID